MWPLSARYVAEVAYAANVAVVHAALRVAACHHLLMGRKNRNVRSRNQTGQAQRASGRKIKESKGAKRRPPM